jgi:hypothetical protein
LRVVRLSVLVEVVCVVFGLIGVPPVVTVSVTV